jgi:signal transduction histidine kinase
MLHELELRQRHLVQSEKLASLGTLLSGVAHELNNPLSNISSSCQILMEELKQAHGSRANGQEKGKAASSSLPLDPVFLNELLSQIDEQTDRARNIVRSLLEFSRDKEFEKEHLPLKQLIKETIRFVRGQLPMKVEIEIDIPDDITIFADKQRIQQAFLNLIKNAVEAINADGKISILAHKVISAEKKEEETKTECQIEGDSIDIKISDTGSGIPSEVLSKIFDPFFTTKDVGKGSGLGLFIVHEIIEEHDGCIAVDSGIEKGTTFLIRLPVKE